MPALLALLFAMVAWTASVGAAERVTVTLGTATPGGGFPVYGAALKAAIEAADPGLVIETRHTRGSGENVPLLEAGRLDLGLVQGESVHEALSGIGRPPTPLRILTAMYPTPGMFVVPAASPFRTISDLKGQKIAFGAEGSGLVILARYVLEGMGLEQKLDFDAVFLKRAGDGPAMIANGHVAALWGGGIGWPGFDAVARQPGGARFIVPSREEIARILARHGHLRAMEVPAGTYPGQGETLTSVGSWSFVLVRPDLDATTAYRLARALHRAEADLARRLPQAATTTVRHTRAALPRPGLLHDGVVRYYREAGLLP